MKKILLSLLILALLFVGCGKGAENKQAEIQKEPAAKPLTLQTVISLREYEGKAPGQKRIYTCGEKEHLASLERAARGIPVDPVIRKELCAMRDELGLPYSFPFETSP